MCTTWGMGLWWQKCLRSLDCYSCNPNQASTKLFPGVSFIALFGATTSCLQHCNSIISKRCVVFVPFTHQLSTLFFTSLSSSLLNWCNSGRCLSIWLSRWDGMDALSCRALSTHALKSWKSKSGWLLTTSHFLESFPAVVAAFGDTNKIKESRKEQLCVRRRKMQQTPEGNVRNWGVLTRPQTFSLTS